MDVATELRKARADMIGTADESLYRACHSAADELDRLRADRDAALGLLHLIADSWPITDEMQSPVVEAINRFLAASMAPNAK